MIEAEAKELASVAKWGEPNSEWRQDRPNAFSNGFGVVDEDGKTIRGVQVDFEVCIGLRTGSTKFIFTLRRLSMGSPERVYQLEINCRGNLKPNDHAYSHEHFGDKRYVADSAWANLSFEDAVKMFCDRCNLVLVEALPNYQSFKLK